GAGVTRCRGSSIQLRQLIGVRISLLTRLGETSGRQRYLFIFAGFFFVNRSGEPINLVNRVGQLINSLGGGRQFGVMSSQTRSDVLTLALEAAQIGACGPAAVGRGGCRCPLLT